MDPKDYQALLSKLGDSHSCYVLVACKGPDELGNIHITMNYEGDSALASLLVQGASERIDQEIEI